MRRIARSLSSLRRLIAIAVGLFAVLIAACMPATAADYIPQGSPVPQGIRWVNSTATGVNTSAWANVGGTVSKFPVHVPSSTLGGLARGFLKRAVPYAGIALTLKDIVNGVGWAIDELQGQIQIPGTPQQPLGSGVWCWPIPNGNALCSSTVGSLGASMVNRNTDGSGQWRYSSFNGVQSQNASTATLIMAFANTSGQVLGTLTPTVIFYADPPANAVNGNPYTDATAVSDYDVGQLLKQHPEIINAILIDPETGAPIRTQALVNALNALAAQLAAANGDPAPPLVEADPDLGGEPTPSQTDWPGFCDWAGPVCDFIDWVKKPEPAEEEPEVPWDETPPEAVTWSSGLGAGGCPAPVSFSVTIAGLTVAPEFEVQPICDFGEKVRPLVIALASLLGVFIVGGWRNGKNA